MAQLPWPLTLSPATPSTTTEDREQHETTTWVDYDTGCEAPVTGDKLAEILAMNHYETNQINWPSEKNARELNSFAKLRKRFEGCKGLKLPSTLIVEGGNWSQYPTNDGFGFGMWGVGNDGGANVKRLEMSLETVLIRWCAICSSGKDELINLWAKS
jgi:hypothetical protein